MIDLRVAAYQSPDYDKLLRLRETVLRLPLGYGYTPEELAKDTECLHIGAFGTEGNTAGCVLLKQEIDTLWRLRQMAVSPSFQGSGIGAALIRFAEAEARQRGATRMMLHARDSARGFYEKLGYAFAGDMFLEIGLPHWKMDKPM